METIAWVALDRHRSRLRTNRTALAYRAGTTL